MPDPNHKRIRVLLIDDDEDMEVIISALLTEVVRTSFKLEWCDTYDKGLTMLQEDSHDVCLLDYRLGERNGVQLLQESILGELSLPVIFLTGQDHGDLDIQALKAGAADYLEKGDLNSSLLDRSIRYSIEQKRIQKELIRLAKFDSLTELANRSLFMDVLKNSIARADRYNWNVAILFLDIDHFKNVNDSLGHEIGDKLLISFTKRLQFTMRSSDMIARFGGDEFAILLENVAHDSDAALAAQKILDEMDAPHMLGEHSVHARPSIGIVTYPNIASDPESIIKAADTAMYEAKKRGRYNYQFFAKEMQDKAVQRTRFEADLSYAIERKELLLHYQPLINSFTGEVVAVETLIRWQHPKRGLLLPGEFIDIAEECGLIYSIGEWVLRQACQQNVKWCSKDNIEGITITINLSAQQLMRSDIVKTIIHIINMTNMQPGKLELELTETAIMGDPQNAKKILSSIRGLGIKIAVDDFGTGYSSLKYLADLPINTLKIDRTFVKHCPKDIRQNAIINTTIALAHNLGFKVVAEGVENKAQVNFLRKYECDMLQGYYFSKPLTNKELIPYIKNRNFAGKEKSRYWR